MNHKTTRTYSTGHSLGGSIAKVVAAGARVPVVGISSPGVFLSARGFGVEAECLKFFEANILAENDLVPRLDRLQGVVYRLGCAKPNPLLCHQPAQVICELVNRCGQAQQHPHHHHHHHQQQNGRARPFVKCEFVT